MRSKSLSSLEKLLEICLDDSGIAYEREYRAVPERNYRWDFAFPEHRLLVEIQGGIWLGRNGAHSSGVGLSRDYEKNNLAVLNGWRVLYFTAQDVRSGTAVEVIRRCLK